VSRIAILGTRGIPARYGGFETFAEELSTRLAARGHRVTVYGRERCTEPTYRGVSLVYLPTWRHKYFDTLVHTFFSTVHLIFHRADVALYCNGRECNIYAAAARVRYTDAVERRRPGAQAKKVEPDGESLVYDLGMACYILPPRS